MFRRLEANWRREWDSSREGTIFISYRHCDFGRAKAIAHCMTQAGYSVEMSDPGSLFASPIAEIATRLHHACAVVVVKSNEQSEWVEAEKRFASSNGLQLIEVSNRDEIEPLLLKLQDISRRDRGFFDPSDRYEILVNDFRSVKRTDQYSNIYEKAEAEDGAHSAVAWVAIILTAAFIYLAIFTYFIHPTNH